MYKIIKKWYFDWIKDDTFGNCTRKFVSPLRATERFRGAALSPLTIDDRTLIEPVLWEEVEKIRAGNFSDRSDRRSVFGKKFADAFSSFFLYSLNYQTVEEKDFETKKLQEEVEEARRRQQEVSHSFLEISTKLYSLIRGGQACID